MFKCSVMSDEKVKLERKTCLLTHAGATVATKRNKKIKIQILRFSNIFKM